MGQVTNENVKEVVRYHKATPEQVEAHENLACAAETFIETILKNCLPCADRTGRRNSRSRTSSPTSRPRSTSIPSGGPTKYSTPAVSALRSGSKEKK